MPKSSEPNEIPSRSQLPAVARSPLAADAKGSLYLALNLIVSLNSSNPDGETIRKMITAGVRAFRLDYTSMEHEAAFKAVYAVRSISTDLKQQVALVFDIGTNSMTVEAMEVALRFGIGCTVDWFVVNPPQQMGGFQKVRKFLSDQKRSGVGILSRINSATSSEDVAEIVRHADGAIVEVSEGSIPEQFQALLFRAAHKVLVLALGTVPEISAHPPTNSISPDAWLLPEPGLPMDDLVSIINLYARSLPSASRDTALSTIPLGPKESEAVVEAIARAEDINADAIVLLTRTRESLVLWIAPRADSGRVFAFTPDTRMVRRFMLHGSIAPQVLSFPRQFTKSDRAVEKLLVEKKLLPRGAKIVIATETAEEGQRVSAVVERTLGN